MIKILAFTVKPTDNGILIRCSDSREVLATDFIQAVSFLTEQHPETISIVWNLDRFSAALFSLLPEDIRGMFATESKVWYQAVKIFYVGKILGLTYDKPLRGRIVSRIEVNLYALDNWLADNRPAPETIEELVSLGNQVLEASEVLGSPITGKMTSPVGLYASSLIGKVPTVFSNPAIKDLSNFLLPMLNLEWVESYQAESFAPCYTADQVSAYPYQMTMLPDTDQIVITYSKEPIPLPCHYAFCKIKNLKFTGEIHPLVNLERDIFTGTELRWLKTHSGAFDVVEGFYLHFKTGKRPYKAPVLKLFETKRLDSILGEVSKRCVNGLSGKLDQQNADGTIGELYNPILAAMVRVGCRLANMDFIEANQLEDVLVNVHLDSVTSYQDLKLPTIAGIGQWRQKG